MTSTRKTAIIDLDSVMYTIGHPNKVLGNDGQPVKEHGRFVYYDKTDEELKLSADKVMNDILTKCEATHYIGYMKGMGTTTFRKRINPQYKANRSQDEPTWWSRVCEDLRVRWKAEYVNSMEVDDAVNITRLRTPDSFICAIDGDLLGLEGTHYNWKKNEWVQVIQWQAEKKFWSDMIAGQPGDNIKGLPGKGDKYVEKILEVWLNGHLTFPGLIMNEYMMHYKDPTIAIEEFYRNYMSLKILDESPNFEIPVPIEVKKKEVNLFE